MSQESTILEMNNLVQVDSPGGKILGTSSAIGAISLCGPACLETSWINDTLLQAVLNKYYKKLSAFVIQQSLMEPVNTSFTGTSARTINHLIVQSLACQWMVGIHTISMIIASAFIFTWKQTLPCSFKPGSIISNAFLIGSKNYPCFSKDLGMADFKTIYHGYGMQYGVRNDVC
jgi:hypothetical protein